MNSSDTGSPNGARRRRRAQAGNSFIELAITVPLLLLLFLGAADFARVFYVAVELKAAARAGAQYGSYSRISAADTAGMIAAAKLDACNLTDVSVTATQCTCSASPEIAACAPSRCTRGPYTTFVTVVTQKRFQTVAPYPGIPSSFLLSGKAIMEVGQ